MDKFCQILTELSARDMPIFLFPDDNLSICIDIKKICFGIANGQISSNLLPARDTPIFWFPDDNLSK